MVVIKFPFTSMQQFNLDWIMQQLHKILQFMPMNGVAGDVLQRNVDGAVWMPLTSVSLDIHSMSTIPEVEGADELAIYDNSLQGNYKGTVADILALVPVSSVNGHTGTVVLGKSDVGLGNVDNVQQYSASNPPPYPVTSVNGMTGDVIVGGGGGGMDATLLWTNPAPTSTFAAQTVALDLSAYKFVLIEYSQDYGFVTSTVMFPVPTITPSPGYAAYNVYMNLHWVSSQFTIFQRRCEITSSGIVFEDATEFTSYNTSGSTSTNNQLGVPKRIWGIT